MTLEEYNEKIKSLAAVAAESVVESVIVPAANELLAEQKNRIIRDGKNSDNGTIGSYNTKPGYYGKEQFNKKGSFKGVGKNGGTPQKTMYLPQGYKQLRDIQGKPTDKVNENYSGQTNLDFQLGQEPNAIVIGFVTQRSSKIRKGQELKRGKIWTPTKQELADYYKNVTQGVAELNNKLLNA